MGHDPPADPPTPRRLTASELKRELTRRFHYYDHPTSDYERGYRIAMGAAVRLVELTDPDGGGDLSNDREDNSHPERTVGAGGADL